METKRIILGLLLLVVSFMCSVKAQHLVRYVSVSGSSGNSGTDQGNSWTLNKANSMLGTGGIDTIKIFSGTYHEDLYQGNSGTSNFMLVYMAATDTSYPTIDGHAGGSDYGWDARKIVELGGDYIKLYRLAFRNSDYRTATGVVYWIEMNGNYGIIDRCSVTTGSTTIAWDYWVSNYSDRGIVLGGTHNTVMNTRVTYTPGIGIALDGEVARYAALYRDTIMVQGESNIVVTGKHGTSGSGYTHNLIEQCLMDSSYEEDNIQINGDIWGHPEMDSTAQILVRNCIMKNAGENAFDPKGLWRSTVEGCIAYGTINDDNGNPGAWGIPDNYEDDGIDRHYGTGSAFGRGTPGRREWWLIYRNNILYSNGGGMDFSTSYGVYHNTFANNRRAWDISQKETGRYNIEGYTTGLQWFLNNISVGIRNTGGVDPAIRGGHTAFNPGYTLGGEPAVNMNGNLYWDSPDSMASGGRFYDSGDSPAPNIGFSAHQSYVTSTVCLGGEDSSMWADPQFTYAPIYPTAYNSAYDFRPKPTSPAIGKAVALTQVTEGNTGTQVNVGPAVTLFRDDYGIGSVWGCGFTILGDSLLIGAELVRINTIDYSGGHFDVDRSITTVMGDRIYFWSGGVQWNSIGAGMVMGEGVTIPTDTTAYITPANKSFPAAPILFSWTAVTGATKYRLCVSADNWATLAVDMEIAAPATSVKISTLPANTICVWNMATGNTAGWNETAFEHWWTFTTPIAETYDQEIIINWNSRTTKEILTNNANITFTNVQQRDILFILSNPPGKVVRWPNDITWVGLASMPQPVQGDTSLYWFIQSAGHTYGVDMSATINAGATQQWVTQNFIAKATTPVVIGVACSDESTDLEVSATPVMTFRVPFAFTLTGLKASVGTAPIGDLIYVDIHENGTTILMQESRLSIDAGEKTSTTAEDGAIITDSAIANDSELTIYIDNIGSSIAGKGLKIWLIGTRILP